MSKPLLSTQSSDPPLTVCRWSGRLCNAQQVDILSGFLATRPRARLGGEGLKIRNHSEVPSAREISERGVETFPAALNKRCFAKCETARTSIHAGDSFIKMMRVLPVCCLLRSEVVRLFLMLLLGQTNTPLTQPAATALTV